MCPAVAADSDELGAKIVSPKSPTRPAQSWRGAVVALPPTRAARAMGLEGTAVPRLLKQGRPNAHAGEATSTACHTIAHIAQLRSLAGRILGRVARRLGGPAGRGRRPARVDRGWPPGAGAAGAVRANVGASWQVKQLAGLSGDELQF